MAEGWHVTNQRQTTTLMNGQFTDVEEITFMTDSGSTGSVRIPLRRLSTTDYVKEQIDQRVAAVDAVHNL